MFPPAALPPLVLVLFVDWKRELLLGCGTAQYDVRDMGDPLLELLFADGCAPTLAALLDYSMCGLAAGQA